MSGRSGICSMCGKEVQNLTMHMINVHQEKEVKCEHCDKSFKSVNSKLNHVNNVHGLSTSCLICELTFPSNTYLRVHVSRVHNKEKQFSCDYCKKLFSSKAMLKQHDINVCTVKFNSSFKCKQCDKIFEKKNSLVNHVKVHEHKTSVPEMSLKEKCQVCFKEVFQKNMKKHMNSHTKNVQSNVGFGSYVKEGKDFSCDQCPLTFASNYSLKRQLNILMNTLKRQIFLWVELAIS